MSASKHPPRPIEGVPDDILRLIFLIHVENHGYGRWMTYDWMQLAQVSKRWNFVLLSNPAFFTSVCMPAGVRSTNRLTRLLALSKTAPLVVSLSEEHILRGAALLAPHLDRVEDLHLVVRGEPLRHRQALEILFHGARLASLQSLDMDICLDEPHHRIVTPAFKFAIPIAPLKDFCWVGAWDWSSPIMKADLRRLHRLQIEQCDHPGHSSPLSLVQVALQGMSSLQLLIISHPAGYSGTLLDTDLTINRRVTLPHLRYLSLEMPARDLAALNRSICAPMLGSMYFSIRARLPDAEHTRSLEAVVRSVVPHLEHAAQSRPPLHLELKGPFDQTSLSFVLTLRLHTTTPATKDNFDPWPGYVLQRSSLPTCVISSHAAHMRDMLGVLSLAFGWKRLDLEGLTINSVILSAATWQSALRNQDRIVAMDIDAPSCVTFFEALQQDTNFLPALAHVLLRGAEFDSSDGPWLNEDIRTHLRATFGLQSMAQRKLGMLLIEDSPEFPIVEVDLDGVKECADVVSSRPTR